MLGFLLTQLDSNLLCFRSSENRMPGQIILTQAWFILQAPTVGGSRLQFCRQLSSKCAQVLGKYKQSPDRTAKWSIHGIQIQIRIQISLLTSLCLQHEITLYVILEWHIHCLYDWSVATWVFHSYEDMARYMRCVLTLRIQCPILRLQDQQSMISMSDIVTSKKHCRIASRVTNLYWR